jgi:hypothetical protein
MLISQNNAIKAPFTNMYPNLLQDIVISGGGGRKSHVNLPLDNQELPVLLKINIYLEKFKKNFWGV